MIDGLEKKTVHYSQTSLVSEIITHISMSVPLFNLYSFLGITYLSSLIK